MLGFTFTVHICHTIMATLALYLAMAVINLNVNVYINPHLVKQPIQFRIEMKGKKQLCINPLLSAA